MQIPPFKLLVTALVTSLALEVPILYFSAMVNVPQIVFEDFENSTFVARGIHLSKRQLGVVWAVIVASFSVGAVFGCLLLRPLADNIGRKRCLYHFAPLVFVVAGVLMFSSYASGYIELFALGRCIAGFGTGFVAPLVPLFLMECSPDEFRGTIASITGIFITFGYLLVLLLGQPEALGTASGWPYLIVVGCAFPIIALAISPMIHESPKYLYLMAHKDMEAIKSLQFYYGYEVRTRSILENFRREEGYRKVNLMVILQHKHLRMSLFVSLVCVIVALASGVTVLTVFSTELLLVNGATQVAAQRGTVLLGVVAFIGSFFVPVMMTRFPRRWLFIYGLAIITVMNVMLTIFDSVENAVNNSSVAYLSVMVIFINQIVFSLGPDVIRFIIPNELSVQSARTTIVSMCSVTLQVGTSVAIFMFLPLIRAVGSWAYIIQFVIPSVICIGFLYFKLPETKGRRIADILRPWMSTPGDPSNDADMLELISIADGDDRISMYNTL